MDIAALSTSLSQVNIRSQVGNAILDKTMDTNEVLGQGLIEMIDAASMERSVNPEIGGQFDLRV